MEKVYYGSKERDAIFLTKYGALEADRLDELYTEGLSAGKTYWFGAETVNKTLSETEGNVKNLTKGQVVSDMKKVVSQENGWKADDVAAPSGGGTNPVLEMTYHTHILFFMPVYELTYAFKNKTHKVLVDGKTKRTEIYPDVAVGSQSSKQVSAAKAYSSQKASKFAGASLGFGIAGLILSWIMAGYLFGTLASVFGIVSLAKKASKGKAITGLIFGLLSILLSIIFTSTVIGWFGGGL